VNCSVRGSYRFSPPWRVPIHKYPSLSSTMAVIQRSLRLLMMSGSGLKVLKLYPSYRLSPSSVPNHRKPMLSWKMTRTELWDSPCSMLMWSKRRTQLHTSGRDVGETRLGVAGRLFAVPSAVGAAGGVFPFPQEASTRMRKSPIKREKFHCILLLIPTV